MKTAILNQNEQFLYISPFHLFTVSYYHQLSSFEEYDRSILPKSNLPNVNICWVSKMQLYLFFIKMATS